ncbi:hypothetical protein [Sphingobium lignivorans]|uniref:Uncharacterized protein n=1 Tax=Sphingobium lignivorans TaxID=2735886 RepID=A0ABR6NFA0_9SPHN|nr:hypothetical protein [Sphingobium lignivorans]MBB5985969.1 hypothetical protein [Sphingobium lignivorans]
MSGETHLDRVQQVATETRHFFEKAYPHITPADLERIGAFAADLMALRLTGETLAASTPQPAVRRETFG